MKKVISLFLSIVMLISVTAGMSITAQAAGWLSKSTNINLNQQYTLYCTNNDLAYTTLGSNGYYKGLHINVPVSGSVTFNFESDYKYACPDITIYKSTDLDNSISRFGPEREYNSAYGVYKTTINTSLTSGEYYVLCDIYDCYDYIRDGRKDGSFKVLVNYKPNISTPSTLKVSTRNTTSLKLSWSKVSGASGYQLQRKSGDSYKTLTNTTAVNYTVKNLSAGTSYAFRVRAYRTVNGKKYYSGWKTLTTPTKPNKPTIKAPSTNKKHQIIVKWNAVSKCTGYQVQYSKKKNFSSVIATKTVSGRTKTSYTGKNFTKGKTYYVRVRSYKTVNNKKYYSAWSTVKKIKCK